MKIALAAPLTESIPPKYYGGTERVVAYLAEELVRLGHAVTLFASGDSQTAAELRPVVPQALRLARCLDPLAHHVRLVDQVCRCAGEFDLIHFHFDYLHFPLMRHLGATHLTTLHGRLDLPDLVPVFRDFPEMPLISISNDQRVPLPFANWRRTVYNGVPAERLRLHPEPGRYLAFLGRISPEKRLDRAIEIATRTHMPLKVAAKVDSADREYFDSEIKHLLNNPLVEYIGEIGEEEKDEFLGNAYALLFPIDWPEPFGMVMIEAMACGTPVIAWRRGSVPEVMHDGVTGFVVDDMEAAVAAVEKLAGVSRFRCRRHFEEHFSAARMAQGYLYAYSEAIAERDPGGTRLAL